MAHPDAAQIAIRMRFAWWWEFYLYGLVTISMLFGVEPDEEKFVRVAVRAMRVRIGPGPWKKVHFIEQQRRTA